MERTAEHTGSEISADVLTEKLSKYWALHERKEGLERRLERAAAEKATVSERIYERVVADYRRELESVDTTLEPMRAEVAQLREMCEQQRNDIRRAIAELEDELAEADFRRRVGEFTDADVSRIHDDVSPKLGALQRVLSDVDRQIDAFDHPPARTNPQVAAPVDQMSVARPDGLVVEMSSRPGTAPVVNATPQMAVATHPSESSINTRVRDDALHSPAVQPVALEARIEDDPLAALADPLTPTTGSGLSPRYGIERMVFTSGPTAGKVVALSPSMMTIGREHDNTIELKDPEVARYHARIVYSSGEYYIEDLQSSTGTWVNGEQQRRVTLSAGDVVRTGSTEFRFE